MTRSCYVCGKESGTLLVHHGCRKLLTPSDHRKLTVLWHNCVVAKGYDPEARRYFCHHCKNPFPRDRICGDHYPVTKGSDEKVRYDVACGVPSCSHCNTSANNSRKVFQTRPVCTRCRFLLQAVDGLCYRCLDLSKNQ